MAQVTTEMNERFINGRPVNRFRIEVQDSEGRISEMYRFSEGWKRADTWRQLERTHGAESLKGTSWDDEVKDFTDDTDKAQEDSDKRAKRAGAPKVSDAKPGNVFSAETVQSMLDFANLVNLVAREGKKTGIDEESKRTAAMDAIQFIVSLGYSDKDLKHMVNQFLQSSAQNS